MMRPADRRPRTILLTGASSGLGAAIARTLAPGGHRVALVARREDRLEEVAEQVRALGGEPLVLPGDLADPDEPARLVEATLAEFGRLDGLINNAGIGLPRYFSESAPEALCEQVAVNFAAPMMLVRLAIPALIASRGSIINIGSAISAVANPILGAYGATKAGLTYWNDALRREVQHRGVSVSFVDLGPVSTEFFDAVRSRHEEDAGPRPLGIDDAPDGLYNALRDRPRASSRSRPRKPLGGSSASWIGRGGASTSPGASSGRSASWARRSHWSRASPTSRSRP